MYLVDTPGIIVPKIEDESETGLKLAACHAIRDGILDDELICDYVLYQLNRNKVFNYVNRYDMPFKRPSEDVHQVLKSLSTRFGLSNKAAATANFLSDFRTGKLGRITLDD